ncbi:MAG TPA: DUF58 domain-containing protein [Myxococcota bacterium]|nr:DUF58 domain-containing protein [Myxococcota bacterium]
MPAKEQMSDFPFPFDSAFFERLQSLHLCSRRVFSGRLNAMHISRKMGAGMEFADHRPYTPGDDLRLIDWNLFARSEKLYTKLYRKEEDRNLFFMVDVSASMAVENEKFDFTRKLAAALAYIGLFEMDRVFLHGFAEGITAALPALRGRRAIIEAMSFISHLTPGGRTGFERAARDFIGRHGDSQGVLLVFSDFLDLDGVVPGLDILFRRGFEVLALHVVTPGELRPTFLGQWRLADPEGGRPHVEHVTRRMLARYRRTFHAHAERLQRHVRVRGGGYLRAVTDTPLEELILKELRAGRLLV